MQESLTAAEVAAMTSRSATNLILGIDPGPEMTATCCIDDKANILSPRWIANEMLLTGIREGMADCGTVLIESPQAQDRPLGKQLRDTIWWAGRFAEALDQRGLTWIEAEEYDVRLWLTGNQCGNNAALFAALKQRFGDKQTVKCERCIGGGKIAGSRGLKNCQHCKGRGMTTIAGPLAGLNEHVRSALAVAVWHWERTRRERRTAV